MAGASAGESGGIAKAHPIFFEQVVAAVTDYAIFTMDSSGVILDWNQGAERIKRYKADEIVGRHFSCFYSEEDRAKGIPAMELEVAKRDGRFSDEGWRLRGDGSQFWAGLTITHIPTENRFIKITRDLTERMLATEALRQSEERFRLLLEGVTDHAIFLLDPEGHVMSWNTGAHRLKGYEEREILGRHFSVFYPEESRNSQPTALLRKALTHGRSESEGWRIRKDGSRFWANVVITALFDVAGELRGYAKVTRDLTERRNVEVLQEIDRRKDAFLATLAHELRNPLAPLLFGVDLLIKSPGDADVLERVAPMLQRQVDQMSRLIDDLLDMSRVNTGKVVLKKERVSLKEVIDSAVETVAPAVAENGHQLTVQLPNGLTEIEVDSARFSQIISNLLSNAVKFTPAGGHISVEGSIVTPTTLRLTVSDNGRGIAPALQGRVFELFEQGVHGAGGGLGIGLTLVRAITELHGGTVTLTSAGEGMGSEFHLILPVLIPPGPKPQRIAPIDNGTNSFAGVRVLVADDSKSAADILGMFFDMEGMETRVAYDGLEAVEAARTFHPQLVLLDLGMPRMDGFEAAGRIRMLDGNVVIGALSGWGGEDDRRRSVDAGFDFHLVKPVKPEDLRAILAKFVRSGSIVAAVSS